MSIFARNLTTNYHLLYGKRCKCGCLYQDHTEHGSRCPWFPGMEPSTFTVETRLTKLGAWYMAYHRNCEYESPSRSFGDTGATVCGRPIPAEADPCIRFCNQHLLAGLED
jgi:hypothetical protein